MPDEAQPVHVAVLPSEVIELGNPTAGEFWIDGTAGAGGHSRLLAERLGPDGEVLAVDRDPEAVERLEDSLADSLGDTASKLKVVQGSYHEIPEFLRQLGRETVDGVLLDLGLSSDQLEDRERGFSFQGDGELDMRFDPTSGQPVWMWLRTAKEKEIADAIYQYGEERFSRRIARRIVETRRQNPVKTVAQLRELIYASTPSARRTTSGRRAHGRIDPATRTFQALRIVANQELQILEKALQDIPEYLSEGGRFAVISFHSLEDRLVKHAFRNDSRLEILTKKPIQAGEIEIARNSRARSAKLRVAVRKSAPGESFDYS